MEVKSMLSLFLASTMDLDNLSTYGLQVIQDNPRTCITGVATLILPKWLSSGAMGLYAGYEMHQQRPEKAMYAAFGVGAVSVLGHAAGHFVANGLSAVPIIGDFSWMLSNAIPVGVNVMLCNPEMQRLVEIYAEKIAEDPRVDILIQKTKERYVVFKNSQKVQDILAKFQKKTEQIIVQAAVNQLTHESTTTSSATVEELPDSLFSEVKEEHPPVLTSTRSFGSRDRSQSNVFKPSSD